MNMNDFEQIIGTGLERETLIDFNEAEKTASVYTCNKAMQNKLRRLAEQRPEECRLVKEYPESKAIEFDVPKAWVKVSPPRKVSEEQKAAAAKRFAEWRNANANSV